MRYLAVAALCSTLILAGCGEDSRPAPMEPTPEAADAIRCIKPGFPIATALLQIAGTKRTPGLYPLARPRPLALALARVSEIAALWTFCKPDPARAKLTVHIGILLDDFRDGRLTGGTSAASAQRVNQHINTMLEGVGLEPIDISDGLGTGANFGTGFFEPGEDLRVQARGPTGQVEAALLLDGEAFDVPTIITIVLRSDFPEGEGNPQVFAPFYEMTASNTNPTPELNEGQFAVVGFCIVDGLDEGDDVPENFPTDPVIAHIQFNGVFERLPDADPGQYESLGLDCSRFGSELGDASLFQGGLKGFAKEAPRRLRAFAERILLPTEAQAALVGRSGLGGLARNLSPFGVTEREESAENHLTLTNEPNFSHYFEGGQLDTCHDGCRPEVQMRDDENNVVGAGTNVTVELIVNEIGESPAPVLSGTLTKPLSGAGVSARFDDLSIDRAGTYQLRFTAPGADPVTSASFHVYRLAFQRQPTATPNQTVLAGDFLGETVAGFPNPVVQVRIVDFNGTTVPDHTSTVHLSITEGQLNGDVNITDNSGVASFTQNDSSEDPQIGLTVDTDGTLLEDLQLEASVFDEPPVLSAPFNVDGETF